MENPVCCSVVQYVQGSFLNVQAPGGYQWAPKSDKRAIRGVFTHVDIIV